MVDVTWTSYVTVKANLSPPPEGLIVNCIHIYKEIKQNSVIHVTHTHTHQLLSESVYVPVRIWDTVAKFTLVKPNDQTLS